jgi:hypothetical protein
MLARLSSNEAESGATGHLQSLLLAVQDRILTHLPLPLTGVIDYQCCTKQHAASSESLSSADA